MNNKEILIGTENVVEECKKNSSTSLFTQSSEIIWTDCFENNTLKSNNDNSLYVIESFSNSNSLADGSYIYDDPFKNKTDFLKDTTYHDCNGLNIVRYSLSINSITEFSVTYPNSNLSGNQLCVAVTACCLLEFGFSCTVIIRKMETFLLNFCEQQKLKYLYLT